MISLQRIKTTFEISAVSGLQSSIIFHQADSELVKDQVGDRQGIKIPMMLDTNIKNRNILSNKQNGDSESGR